MDKYDIEIKEASYSASQIADYFVFLSSKKMIDEGILEGISPLKLQKILYFAQAASLSLYNQKLFSDSIEAWKYGPVISSIYNKYKNQGTNSDLPVTIPDGAYIQITDPGTKALLDGVWSLFYKYSAGELVEMTHQHDPWKKVYKEGENVVIEPISIRDYYKDIFTLAEEE